MRDCRYERDVGEEKVLEGITKGYLSMCLSLGRISISFITFSKWSNDPKVLRTIDI